MYYININRSYERKALFISGATIKSKNLSKCLHLNVMASN